MLAVGGGNCLPRSVPPPVPTVCRKALVYSKANNVPFHVSILHRSVPWSSPVAERASRQNGPLVRGAALLLQTGLLRWIGMPLKPPG